MNSQTIKTELYSQSFVKTELEERLFSDPDLKTYVIFDGCAFTDLLETLEQYWPPHCCLYLGELDPEVYAVAPWLIELIPDSKFTDWALNALENSPCGILVQSNFVLNALRGHFRRLTLAELPDKRIVYCRFYDPRVLPVLLDSSESKTISAFFQDKITRFILKEENISFENQGYSYKFYQKVV